MQEKNINNIYKLLFIISVLLSITFICHVLYVYFTYDDISKQVRLGQYIGGVLGPFWTLTSVIVITRSLSLQRKNLSHQIEVYYNLKFDDIFKDKCDIFYKLIHDKIILIKNCKINGIQLFNNVSEKINSLKNEHLKTIETDFEKLRNTQIISLYQILFDDITKEEKEFIKNVVVQIVLITNCVDENSTITENYKKDKFNFIRDNLLSNSIIKLIACYSFFDNGVNFEYIYRKLELNKLFTDPNDKIYQLINSSFNIEIKKSVLLPNYYYIKDNINVKM